MGRKKQDIWYLTLSCLYFLFWIKHLYPILWQVRLCTEILSHTYFLWHFSGHVITEMGHTFFNQSFLDSRDHGGFLYVRATFQCVQKLVLPNPPFLFGILLQKWETPWAKVFPLRLLLRLGAEYRCKSSEQSCSSCKIYVLKD